ncbi:KAP family NTPase [Brachyspira hyodysenteriae]|uniref:P-loop NTPase fold protein n=1 Tax=Brachyspira hyodysenteriae TaxID=159 RepID=UPI002B25EDF3|nr:P-loop NTPase fold protein [Brachyspira hyodysenteriae]WPC23956.1 KAP family NTPase [Brachyspira hyodysenteriae]
MSDNILKPKFISDKPADENFFGYNNSFTLIKNSIVNIIKGNQLDNKVIALSGKWGSGKNTIINMIKKEEKDIKVIEFDTLSLYNEHIKKSFLINLANELEIKETCKELEKSELEESISGTVKKTTKKTGDKLYTTTKIIIVAIFIYILLTHIYKIVSFLGEVLNIFHHSNYKMCNLIISILLSISILFFFGKNRKDGETNKKNKDNKEEENDKKVKNNKCEIINKIIDNIINVIFPFINSSLKTEEISNEETETGDITSLDFKKYYHHIVEQYYRKETHCDSIAIVIDNFDRIETEKIKNILYDLYLFISTNNELEKNIFFIFLIDKEILFNYINGQRSSDSISTIHSQFFEKIFTLIIDIPNISRINWETFFENKLKEAFNNINDDDMKNIIDLYKEFSCVNIIPRDIIYFINKVVLNYLMIKEGKLLSNDDSISSDIEIFKASIITSMFTVFIEEKKYFVQYLDELKFCIKNNDSLESIFHHNYDSVMLFIHLSSVNDIYSPLNIRKNVRSYVRVARIYKLLDHYNSNWKITLEKSYFLSKYSKLNFII